MQIEPRAWHALGQGEVLGALGTGPGGLAAAEAGERLATHGPNVLPKPEPEGPFTVLWRQVNSPLIWVLLASAALAAFLGKGTDAAVVLGVVVVNALVGFLQEWKAGQALAALDGMVPELATVVRDGERRTVAAASLVPGDLVSLQSGDRVPADLRLLSLRNLQVTESALTGESLPVAKDPAPVPADADLGDRRSLAFSGTLVAAGAGEGVVVATGAATELGRISALLAAAGPAESPLTRSLAAFGRVLTLAIVGVAALLFGVSLLRGFSLADGALAAITLAVAAIPEGLPAIVTIALAVGVQRMARRSAVVRRLPSVETLGSTTIICSDKTGTLTRNEMTVARLWTPEGAWRLSGTGFDPVGTFSREGEGGGDRPPAPDVLRLLAAGTLASDASLRRAAPGGAWELSGDPTEGAIVVAAAKAGIAADELRAGVPRADVLPFESENQLMATFHEGWEGGAAILVKGAPEAVLGRVAGAGQGVEPALAAAAGMARDGMRVLAFAVRRARPAAGALSLPDAGQGLELLGLVGMIDPARSEALVAVEACRRAGIAVKMITGDHPETAAVIGRALGIGGDLPAVTGRELEATPDADLPALAASRGVFARVAPEHKLRLVRALQGLGHVVAMTGDGVNDAPALKQSDIGVAMGITGTAVAREAADLVLMDDNFSTIAAAVEEGRRIWDNLVKALVFVLPTNIGEALLILVAVGFFPLEGGQPLLPVLPVQILWINLVATVTLALPLAFEAPERDVMARPPRDSGASLLDSFVAGRTVVVAVLMAASAIALFLHEYARDVARGDDPATALAEARTMAVTSVVLFQVFYLFACRSLRGSVLSVGLFSNPAAWAGTGAIVVLHAGFVHLPAAHRIFSSAPLDPVEWVKAAASAVVVLPVVAIEKLVRRRTASKEAPCPES